MKYVPYYFEKMGEDYLISNILGNFLLITEDEFDNLYNMNVNGELYNKLYSNNFIYENEVELEKITKKYQKKKSRLFGSTFLHIFVLTLECNLKCLYCQAEYEKSDYCMMSQKIAENAVNMALQSPEKRLSFEFQGGEPLLNFNVLKYIIEYTNKNKGNKEVSFGLVTNGQAITQDILTYLVENKVGICFSIDGPKEVHDYNRPTKIGQSNYETVLKWFNYARKAYGKIGLEEKVTALPTITRKSLKYHREYIDFYVGLGVNYVSIREISPFGRAGKNWDTISYSANEFIEFYIKCMDYLIELNLSGKTKMRESMAEMILQKITGEYCISYTDLNSPCGAAIGQMAYNWNGKVYTCDEGRMMANKGIEEFCIGNVLENTYVDCLKSEVACDVCNASCIESNPSCAMCVYNPICGVCPVYSYFTQDDLVGIPIKQERCKILRGIYRYLIGMLNHSNKDIREMALEWGKMSE